MTKYKHPKLNAEDKALFELHMRDVKPLNGKSNRLNSITPSLPTRELTKPTSSVALKNIVYSSSLTPVYLSDYLSDPVSSEQVISFKQAELSHKILHALSQNKIRWKAKLDLHGLTSEQAKQAFLSFIHQQYTTQNNCVLIVHGKGGQSHEPPVLKNLCYHWLRQLPQVLAVHSALAQHGGVGAVYVLLKSIN